VTRSTIVVFMAALSALAAPAAAQQQSAAAAVAFTPDAPSLTWAPCPDLFPRGCELAVLHGDPAKPNADVMLRVQPGVDLQPHTHSSPERMILTAGQMVVKYDGADEVTLTPGSYAYGPANAPHRASCVGTTPCVLFIAFEGPVDATPHRGSLR
jgi:quercetin dioxygenase-like cupin family protein